MHVGQRAVVVRVGKDLHPDLKGVAGRIQEIGVGQAMGYLLLRVDNTPAHGQFAGRALWFKDDELREEGWDKPKAEDLKIGARVKIVAAGSTVRGKWGKISHIEPRQGRPYTVEIGTRWGRIMGEFEAFELRVLAA